ncbi:hypothetical protein GCM10009007_14640 [Formosimonas limnophila]|uniref:DUF2059 domain-containing protein n=1 Tax=Formosimonas limnophila TaxID=1384487 RepID=A0A8J3CHM0_9BURK|nr:hypothetical protein [Formosimonas limnophila]GHA74650.1 hypothetical protein GCM10009007_14640 [Formosimonas limnophila]
MRLLAKAAVTLCLLSNELAFAQNSHNSLVENKSLMALYKALIATTLNESTQENSEEMNKCLSDVMTSPIMLESFCQDFIKKLPAKQLNEVGTSSRELAKQNINYDAQSIDEITDILASHLSVDSEKGLTAFADTIGAVEPSKELLEKQITKTPSCKNITE